MSYEALFGLLEKHLRLKVGKHFLGKSLAISLEFDGIEIDTAYIEKEDLKDVLKKIEVGKEEFKMLTRLEKIELEYLFELGYRYIARHEIGTVKVFKEKPVRDNVVNGSNCGCYDTWVIGKYPIKDHSKYHDLVLGRYEFVKWSDEPIAIGELISE